MKTLKFLFLAFCFAILGSAQAQTYIYNLPALADSLRGDDLLIVDHQGPYTGTKKLTVTQLQNALSINGNKYVSFTSGISIDTPGLTLTHLATSNGRRLSVLLNGTVIADSTLYFTAHQIDSIIAVNPGPTGLTGATGIAGATGSNGATGSIGATGAIGSNGTNGVTGATGVTGSNGSNGSAGATGDTGNDGPIGATGAIGADGATGATGPSGADGTNGATGVTGATGNNGTNGATGITGATGGGSSTWTDSSGYLYPVNGGDKVEIGATSRSNATLDVWGSFRDTIPGATIASMGYNPALNGLPGMYIEYKGFRGASFEVGNAFQLGDSAITGNAQRIKLKANDTLFLNSSGVLLQTAASVDSVNAGRFSVASANTNLSGKLNVVGTINNNSLAGYGSQAWLFADNNGNITASNTGPIIVQANYDTAQITSVVPTTYTVLPYSNGLYEVGAYLKVQSIGIASNIGVQVGWVDEDGVSQSISYQYNGSSLFSSAGTYLLSPMPVRAQAGTNISVSATYSGSGGIVFNINSYVRFVSNGY